MPQQFFDRPPQLGVTCAEGVQEGRALAGFESDRLVKQGLQAFEGRLRHDFFYLSDSPSALAVSFMLIPVLGPSMR
jgi:hypothetical protein